MKTVKLFLCFALPILAEAAAPLSVLIIDGQNNHDWKSTTPALKQVLEETGLFRVDVLTTPPKGGDFSGFRPDFGKYRVVISNYNDFGGGSAWPAAAQAAFEEYVRSGGGFVSYHAWKTGKTLFSVRLLNCRPLSSVSGAGPCGPCSCTLTGPPAVTKL